MYPEVPNKQTGQNKQEGRNYPVCYIDEFISLPDRMFHLLDDKFRARWEKRILEASASMFVY